MSPLYSIISRSQWEQAHCSGFVPRCPADERRDRVHLNERHDIERVARMWFSADEEPIALELDVSSVQSKVKWERRTEPPLEEWPNLYLPAIPLEIVSAVHILDPDPGSVGGFTLGLRQPVPFPNYAFKRTAGTGLEFSDVLSARCRLTRR